MTEGTRRGREGERKRRKCYKNYYCRQNYFDCYE